MGHEWLSMPSPVFIEGAGLFVMSINIIEDANKVDKKSVNTRVYNMHAVHANGICSTVMCVRVPQ